ncbi:hemerythrin domain-containing protein [Nocardia yamanashiensis]|uniref:hemerythrin domain-containing protein n=1 Tax=Nocardia yamanashiensis TaxID=209247 RepID=UPI001E4B6ED8|nr:hemerythrin domain-containing protein [Nocardia yamanashiensis]UGT44497.1 hemerythrin domain-containing protein [Nocardia yamanashiensis]
MNAPDLPAFTVAHRAMRTDIRRLAALGPGPFPPSRETAFRYYLGRVLTEIHHHHMLQEALLWPVIARSAGAVIDLAPLTDDHAALDALLLAVRLRTGSARTRLLTQLADLLEEHLLEEESLVFPILADYVPRADIEAAERKFRGAPTWSRLGFTAPWLLSHAEPAEREYLLGHAGLTTRVIVHLGTPGFIRLSDKVFA